MNFLTRLTFGFAVVLIVLGVGAYLLSDSEQRSTTALIPTVVGVLLLGTGYLATNPKTGRIGGMASAGLVVLLLLGSFRGVFNLIGALGDGGDITVGMMAQVVIVILSLVYLGVVGQHMRQRAKGTHAA